MCEWEVVVVKKNFIISALSESLLEFGTELISLAKFME